MSDLAAVKTRLEEQLAELRGRQARVETDLAEPLNADSSEQAVEMEDDAALEGQAALIDHQIASVSRALERIEKGTYGECVRCRSEEHTSELQSLMRISYAVFCLKKTKFYNNQVKLHQRNT